jgi:hypothetical protein
VYRWWATLLLAMIVIQVGLAGYGAFYAAHRTDRNTSKAITEDGFDHGFAPHAALGYIVVLAGLVLLVIGAIAGVGRWRLGRHGVIAGLLVLQLLLAWIGVELPAIGFFHAINAFVIFALAVALVVSLWRETSSAQRVSRPDRGRQRLLADDL